MLALGIVEQINSQYSVKVRIPILHRAGGDVNSTPTEMLPDAMISAIPGSFPNYTVGTVVVVGFDRNDDTSPIIIGALCTENEYEVLTDIASSSINVKNSCTLPKDTTIGGVTPDKISTLKNVTADIQAQIDDIVRRVENLENS